MPGPGTSSGKATQGDPDGPRRARGRGLRHAPPEPPGFDAPLELALRRLPVEQRAVIALHYAADLPLPAVAAALDVPVGTAKSRLSAALARLRADLVMEP